jgi:methylenetetrahydrofolate reductase (NADH)
MLSDSPAEEVATIVDCVRGYSLEATQPSATEITTLATIAPAGTRVYVTAVPARPPQVAIEVAIRLRAVAFDPVPHLAVRSFASLDALNEFLARLGSVERILIIAGDYDAPAGPFRSAIDVINRGQLQRRGISEIGIAGYPEGHPRIPQHDLARALAEKISAAEQTGIRVHIVAQFAFDPASILAWIGRLRDFGLDHPVRVGLAGPTNVAALLRYAGRCGVRASAQGLARQAGLVRQLFGLSAPDALVRALAQACAGGRLGEVKPHFFSFGGLPQTARWAQAVATRRLTLEAGPGFRVEPTE